MLPTFDGTYEDEVRLRDARQLLQRLDLLHARAALEHKAPDVVRREAVEVPSNSTIMHFKQISPLLLKLEVEYPNTEALLDRLARTSLRRGNFRQEVFS